MPSPVINPVSSGLFPFLGEQWNFKPAATNEPTSWREVIPLFAFTVDAGTDVLTAAGTAFVDGDRVRVTSAGTIPAGLTAGAYYFVRDASGTTFKLAATLGGAAINITDTGTGTHYVGFSGLPPGVNLNNVTGQLSGAPTEKGAFHVALIAHNGFLASAFTVDAGTDVLTLDDIGDLVNGDVVRVSTNGTLPAGLAASTDYYVRDLSGSTFKLAATVGGSAINITDTGSGTHRIGKLTDGDSAEVVFSIGVRDARTLMDASLALEWDWDTNQVRKLGGQPSSDQALPIFYLKNGDQLPLAVRFVKGALPFSLDVAELQCAIKIEDEDPKVIESDPADFGEEGTGPNKRYFMLLDMTATPTGGETVVTKLEEIANLGPDVVDGWLELRCKYNYDVFKDGSTDELERASRSIPIKISRSLIV